MPPKRIPVMRSPRGVLSAKPVYMRLMPHERVELEKLAGLQNRSTSSVARLIFVEGIDAYRAKAIGRAAKTRSDPAARY